MKRTLEQYRKTGRKSRAKGKRFEKQVRTMTHEAFGMESADCYATQGSGSGLMRGDAVLSDRLLTVFPVHMEMKNVEKWSFKRLLESRWLESSVGKWFTEADKARKSSPVKEVMTLLIFTKNRENTYCMFRASQFFKYFTKHALPVDQSHIKLREPTAYIFTYQHFLNLVSEGVLKE